VSQPAITAQIKALEDEFHVALFARTSSGMVLSKAGQRLLVHAEKVLAAAQEFKNEATLLGGELAGKLSMGTLSEPEFIRLGEFLHALMERFPLIELELRHQISGMAIEHVRDRTLDASFYFGELGDSGVAGLRLRDITYRVTAPAAWKDRLANADWNAIAAEPWIRAPSVSTHNQLLGELFRHEGLEPTKVIEADHESVINSLIVSGVGVSLMHEEQAIAAEAAGTVFMWGKARLTTALWFIYQAERSGDPVIKALIEVMRETWRLN
jgi:DNA-binding transcriptional LysR family regulator